MVKKIIAIDLVPTEWVARDRYAMPHFPLREFIDHFASNGVDVLETLVTLQRRVPEDDSSEAVAHAASQFENKRYALEMSGARIIECPSKRSQISPSGFKQSDDQRLIVRTLTLCMKLKPDFLTLVGADGDYAPMVEALRDEGIRTEVVACSDMLASDLKRCAVKIIDLDPILQSLRK